MRAVVQRVTRASVTVGGEIVGEIDQGLLVLVGAAQGDTRKDATALARKIAGLRIFSDEAGKMNLDISQIGGAVLAVSQFTLLGDCRKGRRPSFVRAAEPSEAEHMYLQFVDEIRTLGLDCQTGIFRADMAVELVNDGPITLLVDTHREF